MMRRNLKHANEGTSIIFYHNSGPSASTANFLYCGHPRDRELMSLIARDRTQSTLALQTPRYGAITDTPIIRTAAKSRQK